LLSGLIANCLWWPQIVSVRHRRREEMMDGMTFIVQYYLHKRQKLKVYNDV